VGIMLGKTAEAAARRIIALARQLV